MFNTNHTEKLYNTCPISFFISWGALNLLLVYLLFAGIPNLTSFYIIIVVGSTLMIKIIQFAHNDYNLKFETIGLESKLKQSYEYINLMIRDFIYGFLQSKSINDLLRHVVPLFIVLKIVESTYISAILFVAINLIYAKTYLKIVKHQDLDKLLDKEQEQLEGLCKMVIDCIPKYKDAKKIK